MKKKSISYKDELRLIEEVCDKAYAIVVKDFEKFTEKKINLTKKQHALIDSEFKIHKKTYFDSLKLANKLAIQAFYKNRKSDKRIAAYNNDIKKFKTEYDDIIPSASNAWVLNGLVIENQSAGIKKLYGLKEDGFVLDVLNSASSIALGAQNPWLIKADRLEDHLSMRDNVCAAYHPSIRQYFALNKLSKLHPQNGKIKLAVHSESSGTIVDSIAIESVLAFIEKRDGVSDKKILAVDGTWAGGYGTAREGTGFGIDNQQRKRSKGSLWMDRSLPAPILKNKAIFINILKKALASKKIGGIYLEPDVLGDLGMLTVDPGILYEMVNLMKKVKLPIILDCVQQLGRSGSYWGENVDSLFKDYPLLVLTTAKSSANGLPFGFTIMPKVISDSAYPISQITTNQMNGPLFRALVVSEIFKNKMLQKWLSDKANRLEKIAQEYNFPIDGNGFRGKILNRGVYVGSNDNVKLTQLALFIEDGVLTGAVPEAIRYQPMLLETTETSEYTARIIFRRVKEVLEGNVSNSVKKTYIDSSKISTGLARKNI